MRLASADGPDVLLLQEVPVWALGHLGRWSGMTAVGVVAQPPRLGPAPIPAALGRMLTAFHPGMMRSAFTGQGNAILLGPALRAGDHDVLTLNPAGFRRETARSLGLDTLSRLAWAKERRVCQLVRAAGATLPALLVANLHATSFPADSRVPGAEIARAARWIDLLAHENDVVVIGGDLNVEGSSLELPPGYSAPGPRIDHILVRGAPTSPLRIWPDDERRREGILLSDHAPIELEIRAA